MFKVVMNDQNNLKKSLISTNIDYLKDPDFLCVVGSRLYGTDTPDSDLDIRGFNFMPKKFLLGVKKFDQHQNLTDGDDIVIWSAEKFVKMLLNGSSVALEMLFCPEKMTIRRSKPAEILLRNTDVFISERVIKCMLGYAQSEWRKVLGETTRDLGAVRKEHIKEKGYSYKNAYHAIRILGIGIDLARHGITFFPCSGHKTLKAIKIGDVELADAQPLYETALKDLEELLHEKFSDKKQDLDMINDLLCDLNFKNLISDEYKF